jgi:catechol 2,3-dioxygenase-like lactoylglutathione lyase family enzyme
MRILHTMLRVGDLERAIDFYSNQGRRSLDKASYFRAYGFPRARSLTGGLAAWDAEVGHEDLPLPVEG